MEGMWKHRFGILHMEVRDERRARQGRSGEGFRTDTTCQTKSPPTSISSSEGVFRNKKTQINQSSGAE